jgi:uncharacterized protein
MRRVLLMGLALLTLVDLLQAAEPGARDISTTGTAVIYVTPDEVQLSFGVRTQSQLLDNARAMNDGQAKKLVAALRGMGIDEKDLQTSDLRVEVLYRERDQTEVSGYAVNRSYAVRLRDPKKLEGVVDAALKNGANQFSGLDYRSTHLRKHRDEARRRALRAAREKAADLAKELECTLGSPREINEDSPRYGYSLGNNVKTSEDGQPDEDGTATLMPLGQITIQASVSARFDLVPPAKAQ